MKEHITLLQREIRQLEINLERAVSRPGVKEEEIRNIENKMRLKRDILAILEKSHANCSYGVFWKIRPSDYEHSPEWNQFAGWLDNPEDAMVILEHVRNNPRCAEAKIVVRSEFYEDYGGSV